MAISFISGVGAQTNTVTLGTHATDDLIIVIAARENGSDPETVPTVPGTFTQISTNGAGPFYSSVIGYRIATSGSDNVGTWTNATRIAAAVYRGINLGDPIGASARTSGVGSPITYPALTLEISDTTSWVVALGSQRISSNISTQPPAGTTLAGTSGTTSHEVGIFDTRGGVSAWTAQNATLDGSDAFHCFSVELLAAGGGGAPAVFKGVIGGGMGGKRRVIH